MSELWFEDLKLSLFRKRPLCEICKKRRATQAHHCLVHDTKRYHRELTCLENLMGVCDICHTSLEQKANGTKRRMEFAYEQMKRGYNIGKWYRLLPLKVKEQWILDLEREFDKMYSKVV